MDHKISHYSLGQSEPDTQPQKTLAEIVFAVKEKLATILEDDKIGLSEIHPRVIISMVITNILVNLLFNSIAVKDIRTRLDMVIESLDEIREMTVSLWTAMEANRADTKNPH